MHRYQGTNDCLARDVFRPRVWCQVSLGQGTCKETNETTRTAELLGPERGVGGELGGGGGGLHLKHPTRLVPKPLCLINA